MSLVHLSNFAAHVKNCTRINLSTTSVPYTKLHLQLALGLYREGFLSLIQRGSVTGPDQEAVEVTPDNIATRRLWLGLKYRNNQPVIREFSMVSKPSRRVNLTSTKVKALASGLKVRFIQPLQPSEVIFLKTKSKEVVEIQEASQRSLEGTVLCRVK